LKYTPLKYTMKLYILITVIVLLINMAIYPSVSLYPPWLSRVLSGSMGFTAVVGIVLLFL